MVLFVLSIPPPGRKELVAVKKLVFDYEMKLSFSSPVVDHRFQLRCVPATGPRQQVVDVEVRIDPEVRYEMLIDSFDSIVLTGYLPEAHDHFDYAVTGIAFVDNENTKSEKFKPLYRFPSALTQPGTHVLALLEQCKERLRHEDHNSGSPLAVARVIMDEVYKAFTYTPGATTIRTSAEDSLALGGVGVCQDYAHVMLALCRQLDIPSRYIAGLLGGEGATHAWVEVYHKGRWIGFDPTHNRMVDDNYITIAHGRDYRDCMLDIGVFSGANVTQKQWVNASVHEQ